MNTTRYNIDTCAMLAEFNASVWTARKLDRGATDEIVTSKNAAAKDAARVNKHLLAGRTELEVIQQMIGRARAYVYDNTLPWSDSGLRLLPTANFERFAAKMNAFEEEFALMVESFVDIYPTLITAQAMALGDMFQRNDYPSQNEIMTKFAFRVNYMPVPTAGDFRVDVGNAAMDDIKAKLERLAQERVDEAMKDVRQRLGDHLKRMSDRLTTDYVNGEAKQRRFHDSLVDGALELCDLTKTLNVVNDLDLEAARKALEQTLCGVDPKDLRKDEALRQDTKTAVDDILNKFSFYVGPVEGSGERQVRSQEKRRPLRALRFCRPSAAHVRHFLARHVAGCWCCRVVAYVLDGPRQDRQHHAHLRVRYTCRVRHRCAAG